jgi:hypothetical protein
MQNRQEWSYVSNSQFTMNIDEFNLRKSKNDFDAPGYKDQILKPVLHFGFVTSQKERGVTINLRVSCYLNDNNENSFKIFTSSFTDNIATFEYSKKNFNESWVDVTYIQVSDRKFFIYVETKELFEKEKIEYFIEKINQYYQLPPDLCRQFRIAAGFSPESLFSYPMLADLQQLENKCELSQKNPEYLAEIELNHENKELCNLIFTDSHFDAAVWETIKKISPKLKSLGYNFFFNEAPEGTTANDFIDNQKMYIQQRIDTSVIVLKLKADLGKLPKEHFYSNAEHVLTARVYFAKSAAIECLQSFHTMNFEYAGVDLKEVLDPSSHDYMTSDEGIAERNHKMVNAYLASSNPVFGLIEYKHALGMQNEILLQLSLHEAQRRFRFIHVYSELPLNEYEANLRAGKIKYPLGLTLINTKEMSEDKVIELVLEAASITKNKIFNSKLKNFSIFNNQEIYTTPSEIAEWETMNRDETKSKEFQPAGPGYGF